MTAMCDREIDRNFEYFMTCVRTLVPHHAGQFALLKNASIVHLYSSVGEAIFAGHNKFEDGVFSIQEVTDKPLDLGFYSHANFDGGLREATADR